MKTELLAAFRSIARDRAVRAVVLTGAGRAFCAGQDLKERLEPDAAAARGRAARALQPDHPARCARSTSRSSGRSTASPPGPARRSRSPATCGSRPRARASCSPSGGSASSPTAARRGSCRGSSGRPRPPSWRCSARPLSAADAERFGLVVRVVPADELAAEARAIAARLAALAPLALAQTKRALERSLVGRSRRRARGRGVPPGDRRRDRRPRRGPRRVPREAAAAVHRGVARAPRPRGALTPVRSTAVRCHPNKR